MGISLHNSVRNQNLQAFIVDAAPHLSKMAMTPPQVREIAMVNRTVSPERHVMICQSCGAIVRARLNSRNVLLSYDVPTLKSLCCRPDEDTCPLLLQEIARHLFGTRDNAVENVDQALRG